MFNSPAFTLSVAPVMAGLSLGTSVHWLIGIGASMAAAQQGARDGKGADKETVKQTNQPPGIRTGC